MADDVKDIPPAAEKDTEVENNMEDSPNSTGEQQVYDDTHESKTSGQQVEDQYNEQQEEQSPDADQNVVEITISEETITEKVVEQTEPKQVTENCQDAQSLQNEIEPSDIDLSPGSSEKQTHQSPQKEITQTHNTIEHTDNTQSDSQLAAGDVLVTQEKAINSQSEESSAQNESTDRNGNSKTVDTPESSLMDTSEQSSSETIDTDTSSSPIKDTKADDENDLLEELDSELSDKSQTVNGLRQDFSIEQHPEYKDLKRRYITLQSSYVAKELEITR